MQLPTRSEFSRADLARGFESLVDGLGRALGAGPVHRRRLDRIDTRIAVSGVRGKSTVVRWLHDIFDRRGYDTFAKVTGTDPVVYYNGFRHEVEREQQVRLYENERELASFDDIDVAIVENQGIRPYTTRLVNESFLDPHVVFITNVREDHLDTLGGDRVKIARSLARAVPEGTPVVCGEQNEALREYIREELRRRSAPVTFVDLPESVADVPAGECVYGTNGVLRQVGEPVIPPGELRGRVEALRPVWRWLPEGRAYNAAAVNDVQSTELVRRSLVGDTGEVVEPLLNLRWDRRGRTASFVRYLDERYDAGDIEQVHVVGDDRRLFEANVSVPVRSYDTDTVSPTGLLDEALSFDRPLLLMGNTVTEFMQSLVAEIDERALPHPEKTDLFPADADRGSAFQEAEHGVKR